MRVGGAVYGIAAEVEDATGAVWTMLSAADGTRSSEGHRPYSRSRSFLRWIDHKVETTTLSGPNGN